MLVACAAKSKIRSRPAPWVDPPARTRPESLPSQVPFIQLFLKQRTSLDVFLFCGEKQEPKMAPVLFLWQKHNPKKHTWFFVFVVCGEPQNSPVHKTASLRNQLNFFCGLWLAPHTYTPPSGRSMRTAQGVYLMLQRQVPPLDVVPSFCTYGSWPPCL